MLYALEAGECLFCGKADIRNPLSLLAHERSRFATCQWELLTPTDISIPLTLRLMFYALEAGECLFCVQIFIFKKSVFSLSSYHYNLFLFMLSIIRSHRYYQISCPDFFSSTVRPDNSLWQLHSSCMTYRCKADIRNPLSLLAHERSRFATCQWELLTPTDISIPLTHRLVLYALEARECLFCVQN